MVLGSSASLPNLTRPLRKRRDDPANRMAFLARASPREPDDAVASLGRLLGHYPALLAVLLPQRPRAVVPLVPFGISLAVLAPAVAEISALRHTKDRTGALVASRFLGLAAATVRLLDPLGCCRLVPLDSVDQFQYSKVLLASKSADYLPVRLELWSHSAPRSGCLWPQSELERFPQLVD